MEITKKQKYILEIIKDYINKNEISPTVRELMNIAGLKSSATVHMHLKKLEEKGYISKINASPRSIRIIKQ